MARGFKTSTGLAPGAMRRWPRFRRASTADIEAAASMLRVTSANMTLHDWLELVNEMSYFIGAHEGKLRTAFMEEVTRHGGWRYGAAAACGCDPKTGDHPDGGHAIPLGCHRLSMFAPGVLRCSRCESIWRLPDLEWDQAEPGDLPFYMTGCSYDPKEHALDCAHCLEWDTADTPAPTS